MTASGTGNTGTITIPGYSDAAADARIAPWARETQVGRIPPGALATVEATSLDADDRFYMLDSNIAGHPLRYALWSVLQDTPAT